jgi:hypothetical protein
MNGWADQFGKPLLRSDLAQINKQKSPMPEIKIDNPQSNQIKSNLQSAIVNLQFEPLGSTPHPPPASYCQTAE